MKIRFAMLAVACLLSGCALAHSAAAQSTAPSLNTTGNALYSSCTPQNAVNYQSCVYYVIGYTDGLNLANALLKQAGQPEMFCMPSNGNNVLGSITGVQSVDIIMGYLQRNPQRRHGHAPVLIVEAFKEAFPCR